MARFVTFVYSRLNSTGFQSSIEAAFFFNGKEDFPCLLSDRYRKVFNIVRTGCPGQSLYRSVILLSTATAGCGPDVRRIHREFHRFYRKELPSLNLRLPMQQTLLLFVYEADSREHKQCQIESRCFSMYLHLGSTTALTVRPLVFAITADIRDCKKPQCSPTTYGQHGILQFQGNN